jgi:hypothetical protein
MIVNLMKLISLILAGRNYKKFNGILKKKVILLFLYDRIINFRFDLNYFNEDSNKIRTYKIIFFWFRL